MYSIILSIFIIIAIVLIALVLLQQGKGADMGASFGSGASATLFGSGGTGTFLSRVTWVFLILFFAVSIVLANINRPQDSGKFSDFSSSNMVNSGTSSSHDIDADVPNSDAETPLINAIEHEEPSVQDQVN